MTLNSRIPQILSNIDSALDRAVANTAQIIKKERDARTPVDTGDLLASGVIIKNTNADYTIQEGDGLPDARAVFTEYGTSRMASRPHMTPAAEVGRIELPQQVSAELRQVL
jgi:HK97 gp10 family phage protein